MLFQHYTATHITQLALSSHPGRKTSFFEVFRHTTNHTDISYEDNCFILKACGCNKQFPNSSHMHFVDTENKSEREISQEPQEKMKTAMSKNIPPEPSCSLHPACTACNSKWLDLHKPVITGMGEFAQLHTRARRTLADNLSFLIELAALCIVIRTIAIRSIIEGHMVIPFTDSDKPNSSPNRPKISLSWLRYLDL